MKFTVATELAVLCIFCCLRQLNCARILVVFPIPSYSHQVPFRPLLIELHKRGHELVVITTNPMPNINSTSFRQINVGTSYTEYRKVSFVERRLKHLSFISFLEDTMGHLSELFVHHTLNNSEVKNLYAPDSNEKFDVLILEMFYTPAVYALAHRFNVPIIGLSSFGIPAVENYALGGLVMPSHESTWEMERNVGTDLSFWKRLKNFYIQWHLIYVVYHKIYSHNQKLAEKYFGPSIPPVVDLVRNTSLVFVNEDPIMTYARPDIPNIIRFHSIHVSNNLETLPQDLQRFVDSATNGFIYFCMGTNARFSDLPDEIQQIFYDVFAKLPYKVIWKMEKTSSQNLNNIYISSWFPQQSVLAHPNIKLYLYQGGLQSTQEAIQYTVPLLGFPVLSDQEFQLKKLKFHGVGNRLDFETLTRDNLESTIREMISNKEYKKNMIKLRSLVQDTPYDLVNNLVWWTEYVIRNKGAPHLRCDLAWEPWYRYYDMDIVAFLAVVTFIVVLIALRISVKLLMYIYKQWQRTSVDQVKKTS